MCVCVCVCVCVFLYKPPNHSVFVLRYYFKVLIICISRNTKITWFHNLNTKILCKQKYILLLSF